MPAGMTPLSGRRGEAARNDRAILDAARAVFVADPGAPIAAVAQRARVGHSALYRRYPSKADLLRELCRHGLDRYAVEVETALADQGDAWETFAAFMRRIVDADTHSLTLRLAGTFAPTEDLYHDADRSRSLTQQLLDRVRAAGAIRPDIEVDDLSFLFEQLAVIHVGDERRTRQLRHRYLAVLLQGLRPPVGSPLPGPAPRWDEIQRRWGKRPASHRTTLTGA